MRKLTLIIFVGVSMWFSTGTAHALGFGRTINATQIGQALNFAATIHLGTDETLPRECVAADVYSGDNKLPSGQVRVTLEPGANADERSVRVTSSALIDEPVITVEITVGCRAKMSRKFVAFVDPPTSDPPQTDPAALPPQRVESQVAPLLAIVDPTTDNPPPAPKAERRSSERKPAVHAAPPPRRRVLASATHRHLAAPAAKAGPRLELESSPSIATIVAHPPDEAASAALLAAAAASDVIRLQAQSAQDRERIQQLEQSLAGLRGESKATLAKLAGLQAELRDAQNARDANPLLYALMALSALLAVAVTWLWRRQSTARRAAQWWAAPEAVRATNVAVPVAVEEAPSPVAPSFDAEVTRPEIGSPHTIPVDRHFHPAPVVAKALDSEAHTMPGEPRDLSVEELIDLEQQVDFFVVLGQDEAAIDLLTSHIRKSGGSGPLPYLKLLEIHRRRGEEDAYARIRERFNRRFNAHAPQWGSDLRQGRALENYPELMSRLEQLWSVPQQAMATLEASLFRRHAANATTFDLPAYEQLLFLYAIARDRLEFETGASVVDLLLPLDVDVVEPSLDSGAQPLDLDVSIPVARPQLRAAPPVSIEEHASSSAFLEFSDLPLRSSGPVAAR